MITRILNVITAVLSYLWDLARKLFSYMIDHFLGINIFEKIIIIMAVPSFFAVVAPMAKYYIFESYMTINNPLAVYLIGIVVLMIASQYLSPNSSLLARLLSNSMYEISVIYLFATHQISKAPYEVSYGFYLNIMVPIAYIILSLMSFIMGKK